MRPNKSKIAFSLTLVAACLMAPILGCLLAACGVRFIERTSLMSLPMIGVADICCITGSFFMPYWFFWVLLSPAADAARRQQAAELDLRHLRIAAKEQDDNRIH